MNIVVVVAFLLILSLIPIVLYWYNLPANIQPLSYKNIDDIKKITHIVDQIAKLVESNDYTQKSLIPNLQTSLMSDISNIRKDLKDKIITKEIMINEENDWKLNTDKKGSICLRNPKMFVCIDRNGNLELPVNV